MPWQRFWFESRQPLGGVASDARYPAVNRREARSRVDHLPVPIARFGRTLHSVLRGKARQGGRRGRRRSAALVAVIILGAPIAVLDAVLTATGAGAEVITNFALKTIPDDIAAGPDGALWFTTTPFSGHNGAIQRMTTGGVVTATYTNAKIRSPHSIATGSDGAVWFINGEGDNGPIGRITTAGVVTTYTSATLARPRHLTLGPDGALWFTNGGTFVNGVPTADKGSIGRIAPDGTITNYRAPSILFPGLITA